MAAMRERMKMAQRMSRIKHKIVVMSGKGGVGKSTVSANLACVLAEDAMVGLVDADVTGPDIPMLMGVQDAQVKATDTGMEPTLGPAGVKVISMAQLIDRDTAVVWPPCGKQTDIFKVGGGEDAAKELGLPFLGRVPLDPRIVVGGDSGKPFVLEHPDSEAAKAFRAIVRNLKPHLKEFKPRPTGPLAK